MAWTGHAESTNAPGRRVPFLLEQKRPRKTRFEIVEAMGMKAVRAYDGDTGWKLRPGSGGRPEVVPYTADELSFARGAQVIEGPLMDYAAMKAIIVLEGTDSIDGRKAYVLAARLPSGGLHRVWVDADSFLELRHDREFRDAEGRTAVATVRYRDYRLFEGLQMAATIETGGGAGRPTNRLVIERVALNPPVDDEVFDQPSATPKRRGGVIVDTRSAAMPAGQGAARQP
jgi:hypothetical protein